jgi:4-carboxymuconolactone decarboxylase
VTPAQQQAVEEFRRLRGTDPFGPFVALLESPELLTRVSALGEYLRFRSALPPRLSEFIILITAAHWQQKYEWDLHAPIALKAGVAQSTVDALASNQRPNDLAEDEAALYDFCRAVHAGGRQAGPARARAVQAVGEQGVIDAVGICGYYALLAMVLNTQATNHESIKK